MKNLFGLLVRVSVLAGLLVAVVSVAMPTVIAYAAPDGAPPEQNGLRLEMAGRLMLKREQIILSNQQQRLNLSNEAVATARTWISRLQEQGKDVAALQNALSAFQAGVAQAQISFTTAQTILNTHSGFDANGKVTDRVQALQTIRDAGRAERQFHLTITQATLTFRQAVRQYRQANLK